MYIMNVYPYHYRNCLHNIMVNVFDQLQTEKKKAALMWVFNPVGEASKEKSVKWSRKLWAVLEE